MSLAAAELGRDNRPEGFGLVDLGEHRLADLARAERIYQLTHAALPNEFPALRSLGAHRQNVPLALTPFVGRERDLDAIAELVAHSRLVTLRSSGPTTGVEGPGPGGSAGPDQRRRS